MRFCPLPLPAAYCLQIFRVQGTRTSLNFDIFNVLNRDTVLTDAPLSY